jgi:hypothetical protein
LAAIVNKKPSAFCSKTAKAAKSDFKPLWRIFSLSNISALMPSLSCLVGLFYARRLVSLVFTSLQAVPL